jgi:hypothetical protein
MYEDNPATVPDQLTTSFGEAVACFDRAIALLECGVNPLDAEVSGWLIGASDALIPTGLDVVPGSLRHLLLTDIAGIERRDQQVPELVTWASLLRMRQEIEHMREVHTAFFANESHCITN